MELCGDRTRWKAVTRRPDPPPLEGNNRFDDGDDDVDNGDNDDGDYDDDEIDNVETRAFICYNVVASLRIQSCRRGSTS